MIIYYIVLEELQVELFGASMSRLDRFLLFGVWGACWPNCVQVALARSISDHCLLSLTVDEVNWGPKPIHMLKCWTKLPGYKEFVREKWKTLQVEGWGGFVIKKKLKLVKGCLKA